MHKILVLIDFTNTSEIAIDQAIAIAKRTNSSLTLSHIAQSDSEIESDEFANKLAPYIHEVENSGVSYDKFIVSGNFKAKISGYVNEHHPELVVVGTHGKHGLKQNLFGSNIYELTKSLNTTLLVVNDHAAVTPLGFNKVLIPISAHDDFLLVVKKTSTLLAENGEIIIFTISKPGVTLDSILIKNMEAAQEYLKAEGHTTEYVEVRSETFSVGYSRETLAYARDNGVDLISIMSKSARQTGSESMDKENILLNTDGVPVLCANQ
jgi:nucleotide-binding universal stress UspA family protein